MIGNLSITVGPNDLLNVTTTNGGMYYLEGQEDEVRYRSNMSRNGQIIFQVTDWTDTILH